MGRGRQLRERLKNNLKLTGYQSIHPAEKFARLPGEDKLPREPPPASSPKDTLMGMKSWKKQPLLALLSLIYRVTSLYLYFLKRRVTWHQLSGCTDVALRETRTQERHPQCNGQAAGRQKGVSPPSPVSEAVIRL